MRKIISILVTLGIVLGLTLAAVPVAAAPCVCPTGMPTFDAIDLLPPPFCAGDTSNYLLGSVTPITLPVTLIPGADSLSVDFPAGTDLTAVTAAGVFVTDTTKALGPFNPAAITKTDTHLEFVVPAAFLPALLDAGDNLVIQVNGVVNPTVSDTYCLYVDYKFVCCDPVQFACTTYLVQPLTQTITMVFDFSPTYAGIAPGFVPPFKACGQVGFGYLDLIGGVNWMTEFDLAVTASSGCYPPCASATMWFVLEDCESGGIVTFDWDNLAAAVPPGPVQYILDETDVGVVQALGTVNLALLPIIFNNGIHFSTPGDYEICFYLQCPAVPCLAGPQIVSTACLPAEVYQHKDALKIPLFRKWNLISLPLVPLEDPNPIENVLAAYQFESDVLGVYYYDRCADDWLVYGNGQTSLATMEDGKSYWVKITYSHTNPAQAPGLPMDGLWIWGTEKGVPTGSPPEYDVCEGWNMVGFTESNPAVLPMWDANYLWNWWDTLGIWPDYGAVYGWDATSQAWWSFLPSLGSFPWLLQGEGYWINFEHDGTISPP